MQSEFEAAVEDGKPFVFAIGCLVAAWREMVKRDEGRLVLAKYVLVLGLLIPMAAVQVKQAIGFVMFPLEGPSFGMLEAGAGRNPYLIWPQNSAMPVLLIIWLLLGIGHLGLAWALAERDWPRVAKFGALIGAAMITLSLFTGVLMLDLSSLIAQFAKLGAELVAILAIARWHARTPLNASLEQFIR